MSLIQYVVDHLSCEPPDTPLSPLPPLTRSFIVSSFPLLLFHISSSPLSDSDLWPPSTPGAQVVMYILHVPHISAHYR